MKPSARTLDIERLLLEHCNAKSISLDQLAPEGERAGAAAIKDLIKGLDQYTNAEINNSLRRTRRRIKKDKENNDRHATMNQSNYSSTSGGDDDYSTAMPDATATPNRRIIRALRPNFTGTPINRSKTGVGLRGAATDVKCHQDDVNWELDPLIDVDIMKLTTVKTAAQMIKEANVPMHVKEMAESEEKMRAAALYAGTTNANMKVFWSRHQEEIYSIHRVKEIADEEAEKIGRKKEAMKAEIGRLERELAHIERLEATNVGQAMAFVAFLNKAYEAIDACAQFNYGNKKDEDREKAEDLMNDIVEKQKIYTLGGPANWWKLLESAKSAKKKLFG